MSPPLRPLLLAFLLLLLPSLLLASENNNIVDNDNVETKNNNKTRFAGQLSDGGAPGWVVSIFADCGSEDNSRAFDPVACAAWAAFGGQKALSIGSTNQRLYFQTQIAGTQLLLGILDEEVKGIKLYPIIPSNGMYAGSRVYSSSWGQNDIEESPTNIKTVELRIQNEEKCGNTDRGDGFGSEDEEICLGAVNSLYLCPGDEGAPIYIGNNLYGMFTSKSLTCDSPINTFSNRKPALNFVRHREELEDLIRFYNGYGESSVGSYPYGDFISQDDLH